MFDGKKIKIAGRICMDQCMFDVTNVNNISVGDKIPLFGNNPLADDIAEIAGTPSSWAVKVEDIMKAQSESLKDASAREKYLSALFATHMGAEDATTFGQVLEWAVKTYVEGGQEEIFSKAFSKAAASAGTSGKADAEQVKKMTAAYSKAIIAAEQARSAPAFKSLTEAAQKVCGKCPVDIALKGAAELPGKPA